MAETHWDLLLAQNPRGAEVRDRVIANLHDAKSREEIESRCLDGLDDNLAVLCVFFFQIRLSASALVRSILINDLWAVAVSFLQVLCKTWHDASNKASEEQLSCLNTVSELLSSIGQKGEQPRSSVKAELLAAYLVCHALRSNLRGDFLMDGVQYDVILNSDIYVILSKCRNLQDVVQETRRRLLQHGS